MKKDLQSTGIRRTLNEVSEAMDPLVRKLKDELETLRRRMRADDQRSSAILTALEIMGIRAEDVHPMDSHALTESFYSQNKPFRLLPMGQAALIILQDIGIGLNKNQVEYLLDVGGYIFEAKDPANSVEIALRRLASEGKCDVMKRGGPFGHLYLANGYKERKDDAVEDQRATNGEAQNDKASG